jgi:hypothetical protein
MMQRQCHDASSTGLSPLCRKEMAFWSAGPNCGNYFHAAESGWRWDEMSLSFPDLCPCGIQSRSFDLPYGLFFTTQGPESRSTVGHCLALILCLALSDGGVAGGGDGGNGGDGCGTISSVGSNVVSSVGSNRGDGRGISGSDGVDGGDVVGGGGSSESVQRTDSQDKGANSPSARLDVVGEDQGAPGPVQRSDSKGEEKGSKSPSTRLDVAGTPRPGSDAADGGRASPFQLNLS